MEESPLCPLQPLVLRHITGTELVKGRWGGQKPNWRHKKAQGPPQGSVGLRQGQEFDPKLRTHQFWSCFASPEGFTEGHKGSLCSKKNPKIILEQGVISLKLFPPCSQELATSPCTAKKKKKIVFLGANPGWSSWRAQNMALWLHVIPDL